MALMRRKGKVLVQRRPSRHGCWTVAFFGYDTGVSVQIRRLRDDWQLSLELLLDVESGHVRS